MRHRFDSEDQGTTGPHFQSDADLSGIPTEDKGSGVANSSFFGRIRPLTTKATSSAQVF